MNKKGNVILVFLIFLILGGLAYFYFTGETSLNPKIGNNTINIPSPFNKTVPTVNSIKIANWNLQIFGDTKAGKPELINFYAEKIKNYDLIFIQEIRDADGSSFDSLCLMLSDYKCKSSSRAGRSTSKEQYGVIYKKWMSIQDFKDYNPDNLDRWERPPIMIEVYNISIYNIHIKPDDAVEEIAKLEELTQQKHDTIVLGDLNMDCDYYNTEANTEFDTWTPTITDNMDTTVSATTDCAYDRIFYYYVDVLSSGVDRDGITSEISDHYLIWAEVSI